MSSGALRLPSVPSLTWDDCRLLVESVTDYAIFMLDPDGYVATWNAGAEKIKGYSADEIAGKHFSVFYVEADVAAGKPASLLEAAARDGRVEDEGWRVRKDGTRFWANVVITALRDASGQLRGFGKVTRDSTERRAAEEHLRQSEERFHSLVDAVLDYAIYMLDPEGHVATWNPGAQRLKGYSAAEIVGKSFTTFFPPEDAAEGKPERELAEARRHGRFEDEGWRVRKDGTRFWANAILTAVHDDQGTLIGFAKVTRDLTARREAEENERRLIRERAARNAAEEAERKVRDSEERYRALSARLEIILEGVADGITVLDRAGALVFANSAAARLFGFESAEVLMRASPGPVTDHFDLFDEQGRPFNTQLLPARLVIQGAPSATATVHIHDRATGRRWWSAIRSSPVLAQDGTTELVINIWHDVTAAHRSNRDSRYLAEATVALGSSMETDEFLAAFARGLVPELADWCSIYLLEGDRLRNVVSTHADPEKLAFAQEYQRRFPPDPSKPGIWNVVRSLKPEIHNDIGDAFLQRAASDADQLAMLRAVGMKAVAVAPILLGTTVLGVISIISTDSIRRYDNSHLALLMQLGERAAIAIDRAQLYRAAQEAARAAEEANRAKDDFLATVSHELRTPLSAILGWATLLKDRVSDPEFVKPIQSIHRNAQAQVRIIEDILDVSRIISGKFHIDPKPVDLLEVARQALDVVRPSAVAKSISLTLTSERQFCLLVGDPERLQQVIWNLLTNAVKFTPSGGSVSLAIAQVDHQVVVTVTDTGSGVEPSFLPYVFDRFRQADASSTRSTGGLGLGLSIVKHIVERHGGRVEAFSRGRGTGATFSIRLPVNALQSDSTSPVATQPPPPKRKLPLLDRVRVLVVDDEADARDVLVALLEQAGAVASAARSATEAIEAFQRSRPDIVLSDLAMPGEDGFSLLARLRKLPGGHDVPVVALTAHARGEDRTKVLAAGFKAHLAKPIEREALTTAVANLVGRGRTFEFG
jgi:PAS domain S-box-containing protein